MIAINSSKEQACDADPKSIQQINFAGTLGVNVTMFFIIEEAKKKKTFWIFPKEQ